MSDINDAARYGIATNEIKYKNVVGALLFQQYIQFPFDSIGLCDGNFVSCMNASFEH